eukprot:TRINITY_DN6054_c2_g1_i2.p1 TRINITY_DN6054_c2_g1~~TRINITY_DN6054_c2_g1_i2.p1  ORF type:complete len:677 (+),score=173.89 TRINITY_DN6054_c2_g1_i2:47-2077(+)
MLAHLLPAPPRGRPHTVSGPGLRRPARPRGPVPTGGGKPPVQQPLEQIRGSPAVSPGCLSVASQSRMSGTSARSVLRSRSNGRRGELSELVRSLATVFVDDGIEREGMNAEQNLVALLQFAAADSAAGVRLSMPSQARPQLTAGEAVLLADEVGMYPPSAEEKAEADKLFRHFVAMNEMLRQGENTAEEVAEWHARWLGKRDGDDNSAASAPSERCQVTRICDSSPSPLPAVRTWNGAAGVVSGGPRPWRWVPVRGAPRQVPEGADAPRRLSTLTKEADAMRKRLGMTARESTPPLVAVTPAPPKTPSEPAFDVFREEAMPSRALTAQFPDRMATGSEAPAKSRAGSPELATAAAAAATATAADARSGVCGHCGGSLGCLHCAIVGRSDAFLAALPVARLTDALVQETRRLERRERQRERDPPTRRAIALIREKYNKLLMEPPWAAWVKSKDSALVEMRQRCDECEEALRSQESLASQQRERVAELEKALRDRDKEEAHRARDVQSRREMHLRERISMSEKEKERLQQKVHRMERESQLKTIAIAERHKRSQLSTQEAQESAVLSREVLSAVLRGVTVQPLEITHCFPPSAMASPATPTDENASGQRTQRTSAVTAQSRPGDIPTPVWLLPQAMVERGAPPSASNPKPTCAASVSAGSFNVPVPQVHLPTLTDGKG